MTQKTENSVITLQNNVITLLNNITKHKTKVLYIKQQYNEIRHQIITLK